MSNYALVGKNMPRVDSKGKVTGQALFTADLKFPKMLVGKILRSPHPHARIVDIDISAALNIPGVKAIVTGHDTIQRKWGVFGYTQDQLFLPADKVRFIGEEIAAVAAIDEDTAQQAIDCIRVEYEVLTPFLTLWNR